ncbi:MAG: hypothetical protein JOZ41_04520, partial [Chloroflexi bacterium]|nr:hypothetical protein [Chloroflexota bacterium]
LYAALKARTPQLTARRSPEPCKVELDDWNWWKITGARDVIGFLPRFEREFLVPLVEGRTAIYHARDRTNDEMGDSLEPRPRVTRPAPVILIEGVGAACRELAAFLEERNALALSIYVLGDPAKRTARGLARPGSLATETDWDDWLAFERQFVAEDGTVARCHLVVDGDAPIRARRDRFVVVGGTATEARLHRLGLTPARLEARPYEVSGMQDLSAPPPAW